MYKCSCCGNTFEEPYEYTECMGEFWGSKAYDTFSVSPCCGEYYTEVSEDDDESEDEEDDI